MVGLGVLSLGLVLALERLVLLISGASMGWGERVALGLSALALLLGFGLAGGIIGLVIRSWSDGLNLLALRAEAETRSAELLEHRIAPALDRLAEAIVQANAERPAAKPETGLADVEGLKARLEAARQVGDIEQILACRAALAEHLDRQDRQGIDRQVVGWLMALIHKRLRAGTVGPDLASLAARVAESFAETPEGASLRAALPTLRRSAGLCPRCAEPYTGVAEACPRCLGHDHTRDHEHWPEIGSGSESESNR
ncbi:hypothetical protein BH23PLA1_BH23PLA1_42020 [soil metagenome]